MRTINAAGRALIKSFESRALVAYKCPAGIWTIGYGHTRDVMQGQLITPERAEELLDYDLELFANTVEALVDVPINENQFAALVAFAFNVGAGALRTSTLLTKLNSGDPEGARAQFAKWDRAHVDGKVVSLPGLTRRRAAEAKLFATPVAPATVSPSWAGALADVFRKVLT
jgi:lysozyme